MQNNKIVLLKGDGIGPEIIDSAISVLRKIESIENITFDLEEASIGGAAIDQFGNPFPKETESALENTNAVLLGAVGGPKWDQIDPDIRPEKGLLALRKKLGVYANLRPCKTYSSLMNQSPLKAEYLENVDFIVVRELIGGIYFGKRDTFIEDGIRVSFDEERYNENEIKRIADYAFQMAEKRKKHVTLVDKANVLDSSKLWRVIVKEVAEQYSNVKLDFLYVDNAAMQLIKNPAQFDIILTNNIFGDILSDEASQVIGSIGLLPSASLGEKIGLYEPIHGSAPDIAGQNIANPIGTILSLAMLLRYSFGLEAAALKIENAVEKVLSQGFYSKDINTENYLGTKEITKKVIDQIN